jgi:mRNA-degrading endonuclease RelE of RelBE toxin-antitoxin system
MKKILALIVLVQSFAGNAQNTPQDKQLKHDTMNTTAYYTSLINDKIEYFDIKNFDQKKDETDDLVYTNDNGDNIVQYGDIGHGYVSETIPKNSIFKIRKEYNGKGVIRSKGVRFFRDSFDLGKWYEYNDSGELIKTTNQDEGYVTPIEEVLLFLEQHKIDVFQVRTDIFRSQFTNPETQQVEKTWRIHGRGEYKGKIGNYVITFLDKTKEIIEVIEVPSMGRDPYSITIYQKHKKKSDIIISNDDDEDKNNNLRMIGLIVLALIVLFGGLFYKLYHSSGTN